VDSQRTPKREKREKREQLLNSEGERVKKPMNAYMIFMKENRERFLAEEHKNPDKNPNGKRIQSADLNRMMGEVWQKMTKADQDV
jgi:hypothetical protein